MKNLQKEIIRITSEYFKDEIDYSKLLKATEEYKFILNKLTEEKLDDEEGINDLYYENGKAISTYYAALCLDDLIRTRKFIRGIDKAILEKSKKKTIHILYAGTGPFASLILPFIYRYTKEDIKYTLLEVNPFTFKILQNVISKLGLEKYDINLVKSDATKYQIDPKNEPDIIISETMQSALAKEQQVPIFLNLMSQIKENVIFIPEKIKLYIGLKRAGISIEKLQAKHFRKINKVFEISKEAIFNSNELEKELIKKQLFTKKKTIISKDKIERFNSLVIITEIQTFKDEKIHINESGLTTPIIIKDLSIKPQGSLKIDTQYIISSEPKLEYTIKEELQVVTQKKTRFLQLPFLFDEKKLVQDLSLIYNKKWVPHFNTSGYTGDWKAISLYAENGKETNIFAFSNSDAKLLETPLLKKCLYFKKVIKSFKSPILSARLLRLGVGAEIKPHRDHELGYENDNFRLHIPIITNKEVKFILDETNLKMLPGQCWYTNVNYIHSVRNEGKSDRVHLVIDFERNEWSDNLFFSLAPKNSFKAQNPAENYSPEKIKMMIAELKNINTPTADQLIKDLEIKLIEL